MGLVLNPKGRTLRTYEKTMAKTHSSRTRQKEAQKAFTLVEMIITSLLVGVIVLGIVPLFTRAVTNNVYGADASQLASFLRSGAERIQQRSANAAAFGTEGNPVLYFDTGKRSSTTKADDILGDEKWVPELDDDGTATEPEGIFLWTQERQVIGYSVADVFRGNIKVGGGDLVPLGNPKLFDNPDVFTAQPDVREFRMTVQSLRGGKALGGGPVRSTSATPSGIKQWATVSQFRAF